MATSVAKRIGAEAPRLMPVIDPAAAQIHVAGHVYREWVIRLPQGAIADDLKEPALFAKLQASAKSLVRHDRVYLIAHDEDWAADAIVAEANGNEATLTGIRVVQFAARTRPLFSDDNYRIEWSGKGYVVVRKSDGSRVTPPVASEQLAVRDLGQQYPRKT